MPDGYPDELKELSPRMKEITSWFLSFSQRIAKASPELRTKLVEWESQKMGYWTLMGETSKLMEEYGEHYEAYASVGGGGIFIQKLLMIPSLPPETRVKAAQIAFTGVVGEELNRLKNKMTIAMDDLEKQEFYYKLYGDVPTVISSGRLTSVDEVLSALSIPKTITPTELSSIRDTIAGMIKAISAPEGVTPEEAVELGLPELIAPVGIAPKPIGISIITTEEILKAITAPRVPPKVMTDEEWYELLKMEGYSDADLGEVAYTQLLADDLIAQWTEDANRLEAFRGGLAEMPDYTFWDMAKEMVVQPGLAAMELAGLYFEHVSQPIAGFVWKTFIPDIEVEYQRLRKTESTWEALGNAWYNWEFNWFVKYMLMEGAVDPLTYVGWGIAARITKPIPYVGRFVGAAERGIQAVFEVPFDLIKAGIKRIPKTAGQRALMAQRQAGRLVDHALTRYTGKPLHSINMKEFGEATEVFIKFALDHPQSEEWMALAGRELLKHAPVDEALIRNWSKRLGTTLSPEDITRVTIENVENLFEDYFMKGIITQKEAGGRLLRILGAANPDDDTLKLAQRLLQDRADVISRGAMVFAGAKSPFAAMRALMSRNLKVHMRIEESAAYLVRKEVGGYTTLLHNVDVRLQGIWRNQIDRMVVRPFAEAYLTFGMYGPMNVLEDYIRTSLGGVRPRRMTIENFETLAVGLTFDPEIRRAGISEMIGYLAREGAEENWNNWILQLATLGKKGWADKLYTYAVRIPGAYGMDVRRNFLAKRFLQILRETGGDTYEALMRVGPKTPTLADKTIVRDLETLVHHAKSTGKPELLRNSKNQFTRERIVGNEVNTILKQHPELPNTVRDFVGSEFRAGTLFSEGGVSIDRTITESGAMILDDFIRGPEIATRQMKSLADILVELEVRNPQDMAWCLKQLQVMSNVYGATPRQVIAQATVRSRGLSLAERRARFDIDFDRLYLFLDSAGADIDRVIVKLKALVKQPGVAISDDYVTKADRLFDILTTKREYAAEFRAQNMATRHEIFAGATIADMKSRTFWDDFYLHMDNEYMIFDRRIADLDGMLVQVAEGMDISAGIRPFQRPAIKVMDRPLAPQDVANLLGCRGDDISRSLLDVLTIQNDREMFITYVLAKTRPGDAGFTRESVGAVYDQIVYSLQTDPRTLSWITSKQMELEAVRRDLHYLHNSKMFPPEEKIIIDKFLDETADAMDRLMYEAPVVPISLKPIKTTIGEGFDFMVEGKKVGSVSYGSTDIMGIKGIILGQIDVTETVRRKGIATTALDRILADAEAGGKPLFSGILEPDGVAWLRGLEKKGLIELIPHEQKLLGHTITRGAKPFPTIPPTKVPPRILKPEYEGFDSLRQSAMDEAHKWYYKEYPDYTNANAFDAMMKSIYPYWTYESQRWFWLPRSFIRHPGTFTAFERWQNNTDYGYVHIPGTSIDINPFRGTIYGTLTTRLTRRDFPEYYDALPFAGNFVEFMDFLSRYGFYPGAHIGIPLAALGGLEQQMGETIPAIWKTPLNAAIGLFPDNEFVKAISERLFSDRFRDYLTILMVNKRGYDGTHIWTKMEEHLELTEEEQAVWTDARSEAAFHGALFEQFGLFRLRSDEQYQVYEDSSKAIEEMTGFTLDQQKWLRMHGYKIWDLVGGISPTQQAILQELDAYRWMGSVRPLLPGRQQEILNRLELDWDDVRRYTENQQQEKLQIQQDFLGGIIGARDYNDRLIDLYDDQTNYIDQKMKENPLMTLEGRTDYYKEFNIPMPVLHPMRELLNLYFDIELKDKIDEETGEKVKDWDTFWAQREAIEGAIPPHLKQEWDDYISRNSTRMELVRRKVYKEYFRVYNKIWESALERYPEEEQKLIKEFLYLERMDIDFVRQDEIKAMVSVTTGNKLVSSFRTDVSNARLALRYANPALDAWLRFWGRVESFQTPEAGIIFQQICKDVGKKYTIS